MASLRNFPVEILTRIFFHIDNAAHRAAICLTCRQFNQITTPDLYSEFKGRSQVSIALFTRTLFNNPKLANYVRSLEIQEPPLRVGHQRGFGSLQPEMDSFNKIWQQLHTIVQCWVAESSVDGNNAEGSSSRAASAQKQRTVAASMILQSRGQCVVHWDEAVACLMTLLPQLEICSVTWNNERMGDFFELFERLQASQLDHLASTVKIPSFVSPRLTVIKIVMPPRPIWPRVSISYLLPIMRLDGLRSLSCDGVSMNEELDTTLAIPSSLESLTLKRCELSYWCMSEVLNTCIALKHLHLEFLPGWDEQDILQLSQTTELLRSVESSLETLTMIFHDCSTANIDGDDIEPMDSFTHFTKLQTLCIQVELFNWTIMRPAYSEDEGHLFSFADLPPNIRDFTIHNVGVDDAELFLTRWLSSVDAAPTLKNLHVRFQKEVTNDEIWKDMSNKYQEQGVILSFDFKRRTDNGSNEKSNIRPEEDEAKSENGDRANITG